MKLLSKIIEFAKQRTIHLTVKHLQRPCFCYSVGGRSVVEFFDIACARTCDRVRVCVCEIIRFLTLSAPMDFH